MLFLLNIISTPKKKHKLRKNGDDFPTTNTNGKNALTLRCQLGVSVFVNDLDPEISYS